MNIFYWSVANLLYSDQGKTIDEDFYNANRNASIAFIVIFCGYAVIRFCFNRIGGLYMMKKLIIAAILAAAVYNKHGYLAVIIGLETIFTITRFCLERPKSKFEKVVIIIEWLVFILAYVLMFVLFVTGVTAFLCTAIVFFMIVLLVSDILDVYMNSEAQFTELNDKDSKASAL